MKKTAIAPSNIAFIKYWGKKNETLRIPENGSISMNLSNLLTTTTVEFNASLQEDSVHIDGKELGDEEKRAIKQLDRIRELAKIKTKAKVVSQNNFPSGTGLSSSASGFAALTVAGAAAAGLTLNERELSILARLGSGSACRSIPDGFVEWMDGKTSETSYAVSLYPADYWDIRDIVVIASNEKKTVPTSEGQKLTKTSPFFDTRLKHMSYKIKDIKTYLKHKDFTKFGELIEAEALELHSIMLTSTPSLIYLLPNTIRIMHTVKKWREEGLECYFTLNTGQDVHIICKESDAKKVSIKAKGIEGVKQAIINSPSEGSHLTQSHLF